MFYMLTVAVHIILYEAMIHDSLSSVLLWFSLSLCWSLWHLHLTAGCSGYCIRHQTFPTAENLRNWRQNRLQWATNKQHVKKTLTAWASYRQRRHWCPTRAARPSVLQTRRWREDPDSRSRRRSHPEGDRQSCVKAWFHSILLLVRRRYATIFMSLEWIRLGLFPRMSQIFTCLSAEDVTRQPRIWLLKSIPTAEVTQGSHCDTIRVFVNILNQFLFFFIYFLFAFKF